MTIYDEIAFDEMMKSMPVNLKLDWLAANLKSVTVRNGQSYRVNSMDDLNAVISQEMYETLSGDK